MGDLAPFARMDDLVAALPPSKQAAITPPTKQHNPLAVNVDEEEEEEEEDLLLLRQPVALTTAATSPIPTPAAAAAAASPVPTTAPSPQSAAIVARNQRLESSSFWQEHSAWSSGIIRMRLVSVGEPQQAARTLASPNPPTTFLVRIASSNSTTTEVRRRYSDFELVRAQLAQRYPGLLQLALPEKNALKLGADAFLQDRARGLEQYVHHLLACDFFQADSLVRSFLLLSGPEWELVKKNIPTTADATTERFRNAVAMTALPSSASSGTSAEDVVRKTLEATCRLESILKAMHLAGGKVALASRALAASVSDLHRQVFLAASNTSPLNLPLEQWRDASQVDAVVIEDLLVDAIAGELDLVSSFRALLEQRHALSAQADQKLAVLHRFEIEVENNLKRGIPAPQSQQRVHEAGKQVKEANYLVECFTKAMFLNGLATFVEDRARAIQVVLAKFATAQMRKDERVMAPVWQSFLSTFRLQVQQLGGGGEGGKAALVLAAVQNKLPEKFKHALDDDATA